MGNKSSLMLQDEEISAIQNETGCKCCVACVRAFTFYDLFVTLFYFITSQCLSN